MQGFIKAALFVAATSAANAAYAIDIGKINGHEITLTERDYEKILKVDGREMHRNAIILFEELTTVSDVPIIIGSSSGGAVRRAIRLSFAFQQHRGVHRPCRTDSPRAKQPRFAVLHRA